jgi:hypothetical protein
MCFRNNSCFCLINSPSSLCWLNTSYEFVNNH